MQPFVFGTLAAFVLAALGCGPSAALPCLMGNESCPCYPNATCNSGLSCRSQVCVKLAASDSKGASTDGSGQHPSAAEAAGRGNSVTGSSRSGAGSGAAVAPIGGSSAGSNDGGIVGGSSGNSGTSTLAAPKAGTGSIPPQPPAATPEEEALNVLAQWYKAPKPQEYDDDQDCGTGCCVQIGTQFRHCYPDSDNDASDAGSCTEGATRLADGPDDQRRSGGREQTRSCHVWAPSAVCGAHSAGVSAPSRAC